MKKKFIKEKGILFWITGFSGSGKSEISYKIKKKLKISLVKRLSSVGIILENLLISKITIKVQE